MGLSVLPPCGSELAACAEPKHRVGRRVEFRSGSPSSSESSPVSAALYAPRRRQLAGGCREHGEG